MSEGGRLAGRRGYVEITCGISIAAFTGILIKLIDLPAPAIIAGEALVAGGLLGAFSVARGGVESLRVLASDRRLVLTLAAFTSIDALMFTTGIQLTEIANIVILIYLYPILTALLGIWLLGEHLDRDLPAALVLAAAGCVLVVDPVGGKLSTEDLIACALGITDAFVVAYTRILSRQLPPRLGTVTVRMYTFGVEALVFAPFLLVAAPGLTGETLLLLLACGLVGIGAGVLILSGVRRVRAAPGAVLSYLEPLLAVLLAWAILEEVPSPLTAVGGGMILLSSWLVVRTRASPTVPHAAGAGDVIAEGPEDETEVRARDTNARARRTYARRRTPASPQGGRLTIDMSPVPAPPRFDFDARLDRARRLMEEQGVDALYVTAGPNMRYLTGYSALPAGWPTWLSVLVLPREHEPLLLLNEMHRDIFEHQRAWPVELWTHADGDDVVPLVAAALRARGLHGGRLGVEAGFAIGDLDLLRRAAPAARAMRSEALFDQLRIRKEPAEIECIRRACRASIGGFARAAEVAVPGASPDEVAFAIAAGMRAAGAEDTGLVFSMFSERFTGPELRSGDIIPLDIGTTSQGYHSDTARTIFVGEIAPEHRRIYDAILAARERVIERIRPGVSVSALHEIAAEAVARSGHKQVWRLGHGIGLSPMHEAPLVQVGNHLRLEPGMVFVVDPGVHLPGMGIDVPIAIEDVFAVTDDSAEWLTEFDVGPLVTGR